MTDAEKWAKIADAWRRYCELGTAACDWDDEVREMMTEMTGQHVTYWYLSTDELYEARRAAGLS